MAQRNLNFRVGGKMYTLAFDTTAGNCSIALLQDGRPVSVFTQTMDFGQAEVLIPQIKIMLEEQNLRFSDLGLIAVCDGPGSFTGVRASVSAARAFSLSCPDIPVAGVSAFDAYLMDLQGAELAARNLVIIETKREDFYFQIFDEAGAKITDPAAGTREDILELLKGGRKVSVIGDGAERFLYSPTGLSLHCIKMLTGVDVRNVAYCALNQYQNKRINFPKPLYLRAPDVCIK
jgi:universal bacterial protein yeaZ